MLAIIAIIWLVVIPALVVGMCTVGAVRRERFATATQRRLSAAPPVCAPSRRRRTIATTIGGLHRDRGATDCAEPSLRRAPASHQARQPRHANP